MGKYIFILLLCDWFVILAQFITCAFQRGSFVSKGERYFVQPADEQKANASTHFRKFHIVFRHPTERKGLSDGPSTCGLRGEPPFHKKMILPRYVRVRKTAKYPPLCYCRYISRAYPKSLSAKRCRFICCTNHPDNGGLHVV